MKINCTNGVSHFSKNVYNTNFFGIFIFKGVHIEQLFVIFKYINIANFS